MYHRSVRWVTKTTWIRIVALFGVYLLVSALWFSFARVSDSNEAVKSIAFLILLVVLPILAMCVATWDGVKEGFSLLWLLAPFVCFLAPMYMLLNDSGLIYGVGYSLLGFADHGLGAPVHARRVRRGSPAYYYHLRTPDAHAQLVCRLQFDQQHTNTQ